MKTSDLEQFGLSNKEASVYLAALELGSSTVQKIAKKAKLKRPTSYIIIKSLTKKGLMSSYYEKKKQFFVAENPERLTKFLESQKKEINEKKTELKKLLPELKSIFNRTSEKPAVRFYEGKEGLLTMSEELLESGEKEVSMVYSYDLVQKVFKKEERIPARKKRKEKGVKVKSIYTSRTKSLPDSKFSTRKKIPQSKFPITCDIAIFGNKVRIASLGDKLSGLIIEDKNIAKTLKSIFNLAWESANKYNKKEK